MKDYSRRSMLILSSALIAAAVTASAAVAAGADALPSWNDGATKQAIVSFVDKVTNKGSPDFVPVDERTATFDNDRTLLAEQPSEDGQTE